MIQSFRSKDAEALYLGRRVPRFGSLQRIIQRKLKQIAAARRLSDLAAIPGNRLEPLKGDRAGQHSVRINDQFRICFTWRDSHAHEVEIVDYH
jgi:proteic killer suppression protein